MLGLGMIPPDRAMPGAQHNRSADRMDQPLRGIRDVARGECTLLADAQSRAQEDLDGVTVTLAAQVVDRSGCDTETSGQRGRGRGRGRGRFELVGEKVWLFVRDRCAGCPSTLQNTPRTTREGAVLCGDMSNKCLTAIPNPVFGILEWPSDQQFLVDPRGFEPLTP